MNLKSHSKTPNRIIFSEFETTLIERRIMYLVVNYLEPAFNLKKGNITNITIPIPIKLLGDHNYTRIKEAAEKLTGRKLRYMDEDSKSFKIIVPFPEISYQESQGVINITLLANVLPIFLELKNGYTQYQIKAALSLTSTYAQRMYELLSRWKDVGVWLNLPIEELRKLLSIGSKYKEIGIFKYRILEHSKTELAAKTDLEFHYELKKTGRSYTHIDFYIKWNKHKDDYKGIEDAVVDEKSKKCLEYLNKIGIKNEEYINTIIKEKQKEFWEWMYQVKTGKLKPKSLSGHLLTVLGINGKSKNISEKAN